MKIFYSIFMIINIYLVYSLKTPTISHITERSIVDIGGSVEFTCTVLYAMEYPVYWFKVDKNNITQCILLSTSSTGSGGSNTLNKMDSRLALRQDIDITRYTLQIKDIQKTDAGFYSCQIMSEAAEVELVVGSPPKILINSTSSVIANEGQSIKLECYVGGYPKSNISWSREKNAFFHTGSSIYWNNILQIPAISKEDRGTYFCTAENGIGRAAQHNVTVVVKFAPVITVPKTRLGQALEFDVDLKCQIEAYPLPAIDWLKNGVKITNNQHYIISHFATADETTDTMIRLITTESFHYGNYTCRASNMLGTAEAAVNLYETFIPICPMCRK